MLRIRSDNLIGVSVLANTLNYDVVEPRNSKLFKRD